MRWRPSRAASRSRRKRNGAASLADHPGLYLPILQWEILAVPLLCTRIIKCRWSHRSRGTRRVSTDHKKAIGLDCRASIGPRNGVPSLGYFRHGTELDGNITAIETVPAIGTVKSWTERNAAAPREREGTMVRARVMQRLVSKNLCTSNAAPVSYCYGARTSGRSLDTYLQLASVLHDAS